MACGAAAIVVAPPAAAEPEAAKVLIERVVGEINAALGSNRSRDTKVGEVERILDTYSDLATISRSALGPPARSATSGQLVAFRNAFRGYLARKYTPRFEEFFGSSVSVVAARPWKSHFQVQAVARINDGQAIDVIFMVSTRSGDPLIFDILFSGISVLKTEALEVRGLLERARGDLERLTANLRSLHRSSSSG
ncbi:MAG: ABC transporter substrate-binding protein [Rhodobacter sp.]|nr:ABC transporter substrate-binding protein [Rhodobacter sp.]MCY4169139.1 ABC transporter substrate-binding protein [Rhodobacter sp.]MCY4242508.1 ABC transporter substrate-binding protein [Rhodobacter sp.]